VKKKDLINLAILLIVIAVGIYRYQHRKFSATQSRYAMDTPVEIFAVSDQKGISAVIDSAYVLIEHYENKFSYFREDSDLWKINKSTEDTILITDPEIVNIINLCKIIYLKSDSLYDITVGSLSEIWDFSQEIVPDSLSILSAQNNTGMHKLIVKDNLVLKPKGMSIILGSVAKGYIVDKVVEYMKKENILKGYVNAGGDIRFFGYEKPVSVGIQHPRNRNDIIAELKIDNLAIVTSGDYERFFIKDGIRYHHIINPKTGYPARNTISTTVIAPNATLADMLSTAFFVMPPEKAIELAKTFPSVDAIIYYQNDDELISLKTMGIKEMMINEFTNSAGQ